LRKAIIETITGIVDNVIEIEPDSDGTFTHYTIPDGHEMRDVEGAGPGWMWDGVKFTPPAEEDNTAAALAKASALSKMQALGLSIEDLIAMKLMEPLQE